jgi:hypothetical protein
MKSELEEAAHGELNGNFNPYSAAILNHLL